MAEKIHAVYGMEPMREGEYPTAFQVGTKFPGRDDTVTEIRRRDDYFGDHGIGWLDIYTGDTRASSISLRAVAEIFYENKPQ